MCLTPSDAAAASCQRSAAGGQWTDNQDNNPVNGPATLTLFALSSICIYAAASHGFVAFRDKSSVAHVLAAGICLTLAGFGISHVIAYQSETIPDYVSALRVNIAFILAFFMLFPWFVSHYAGVNPRRLMVGLSLAFGLLFLVNVFAPFTVQFRHISQLTTLMLPWGESVTQPVGANGPLFLLGSALALSTFVFAICVLVPAWRRTHRAPGLAMVLAVCLTLVLSLEGILVRSGSIEFIHLGPYGFFILVLVMSFELNLVSRDRLLRSERRFRSLVEQSPISTLILAPDGRVADVNPAWQRMWGVEKGGVVGYDFLGDVQLEEQGALPFLKKALAGKPVEIPPIHYSPDRHPEVPATGRDRWVRSYVYPIKDDNGKVIEAILLQEDVTTRKRVEDAIRLIASGVSAESGERFFRKLVLSLSDLFDADHAFIGLLEEGEQERIRTLAVCEQGGIVGNMTYDLAGTPCENVTGRTTCSYPKDVQNLFPKDKLLARMNAESYIGAPLFSSHGRALGLIAVLDSKPLENIEQVQEILEIFAARAGAEVQRLEAEAHMRRMAYEDYLTGLASRSHLHERLSEVLREMRSSGRYGALVLVDLDHFKTINDALGHDVGDEVLRAVARRLQDVVGADALAARVGGDEFVALMTNGCANVEDAEEEGYRLGRRILDKLTSSLFVGERAFNVGASIGIIAFPLGGQSELDVMRQADIALFEAKKLGRGRIQLYLPSLQEAATNRLRLEEGLRGAIANNELELNFQPQVNAQGRMQGVETLLRWHHPDLGSVAPEIFIPVAEETGLIHEIGEWVLEQACSRLTEWHRANVLVKGRLSVNVCPWQFTRPDFAEEVLASLERQKVDPEHLVIEVTETALLYDLGETIDKLNMLRRAGLKIALDDFGTGYSSLAYLRDLPLDQLKIDKAFVGELRGGQREPLVESMITIGKHMNLDVIAEGVETEEQLERLTEMGCELFQGFYFCHPLPEKEFLEWVEANQSSRDGKPAS